MPIVAPPQQQGVTPRSHYQQILSNTQISVNQSSGTPGLVIEVSDVQHADLFAFSGGFMSFVPPGDPMPTAARDPAPGRGVVVLELHTPDFNLLRKKLRPQGIPAVTKILYLDVDPSSVQTALVSGFNSPLPRLKEKMLKAAWKRRNGSAPPPGTTRTDLQQEYAKGVVENGFFLFVEGGTDVGVMPQADVSNPSSPRRFTVRFLDKSGVDLSPIPYTEGMPSYAKTDQWNSHPLIQELASLPASLNAHVRFEAWNPTAKAYQPLANRTVEVKDFDPVSGDDTLAPGGQTDAQGQVSFQIADLAAVDEKKPDVYFEIDTQGVSLGGLSFPSVWSTKGWKAVGGEPGYYDQFVGTQLGSASDPLVFRVGFDYHLKLTYRNQSTGSFASQVTVPKDVIVKVTKQGSPSRTTLVDARTDANGEVSGVLFDVEGGADTLFIEVPCEVHDPAIKLKMGVLAANVELRLADVDRTTLRAPSGTGPYMITPPVQTGLGDANAAMYYLVVGRELATVIQKLTDGNWSGLEDIKIVGWAPAKAFSWPKGWVFIDKNSRWSRSTILHEFAHQVVWNEAEVSQLTVGVGGLLISEGGNLLVSFLNAIPIIDRPLRFLGININIPPVNILNHLYHDVNALTNPFHSFLEGWPEFLADVLNGSNAPPNTRTDAATDTLQERVVTGGTNKFKPTTKELGPTNSAPRNRGESVEGAFANALWTIVYDHVVGPGVSGTLSPPLVPATTNGDVLSSTPWLTGSTMPDIRDRFQRMIFQPLQDLAGASDQDTKTLIDRTRARNLADWHKLLDAFQQFNLSMSLPTITSISPTQGPASGGTAVQVRGSHFTTALDVTFGGISALNIRVLDHTTAEVTTPSGIGQVDVSVETRAGPAPTPIDFQYL